MKKSLKTLILFAMLTVVLAPSPACYAAADAEQDDRGCLSRTAQRFHKFLDSKKGRDVQFAVAAIAVDSLISEDPSTATLTSLATLAASEAVRRVGGETMTMLTIPAFFIPKAYAVPHKVLLTFYGAVSSEAFLNRLNVPQDSWWRRLGRHVVTRTFGAIGSRSSTSAERTE